MRSATCVPEHGLDIGEEKIMRLIMCGMHRNRYPVPAIERAEPASVTRRLAHFYREEDVRAL